MQEKCFLIRLTAANGGKGFCKEKAKKAIF
jgi:hypothetical protein